MKRPYQVTSIIFILYAAFIIREALNIQYYSRLGPGPGFFPIWLGVFLAVMGVVMLWKTTVGESDPMPNDFFPSRSGALRMLVIVLALIGTVLLMKPLGFRITMLAFLLFLLLALGRQRLGLVATIALAGSFGLYHVFAEWLKVPLPVGLLGL